MRYRRRAPVAIGRDVKPASTNTRKLAFHATESLEKVAFGSNVDRFHRSYYYLEDGDPGANKLFSAHSTGIFRWCIVCHLSVHTETPTVQ